MEEYDTSKDGTLDKTELTQLLKALNENITPLEADVTWGRGFPISPPSRMFAVKRPSTKTSSS